MRWWMAVLAVYVLTTTAAGAAITITDGMRLKDDSGHTYAVIVDCPQPGTTFGGSDASKIGKDRCGQCLIDANWGTFIPHPYDVVITGTLVDEKGEPVKDQLIQMYLPNGWTVKTRSAATGYFRMVMGATEERKSDQPISLDLGKRHLKKDAPQPYYALYMLPEHFKPCPPKDEK